MYREQNAGQNHNVHKHLQSDKIQIFLNNGNISKLHVLTHCGRVTQICVFTLQLCRTGDEDLRF
jgi:hypothetical protein